MARDPISAVASWLTPAVHADAPLIAPDDDDARILSLFREWVVAERIACALAECYEALGRDAEYSAALDRTDELIAAISDIPTAGAAGLAIKAYLVVHADDEMPREDDAALATGEEWDRADFKRSILRDAVRFVPELAPLAAAALAPQPDDHEDGGCAVALDADDGGPEASPIAAPVEAKREMTEAERDLVETLTELGYKSKRGGWPSYPSQTDPGRGQRGRSHLAFNGCAGTLCGSGARAKRTQQTQGC